MKDGDDIMMTMMVRADMVAEIFAMMMMVKTMIKMMLYATADDDDECMTDDDGNTLDNNNLRHEHANIENNNPDRDTIYKKEDIYYHYLTVYIDQSENCY